MNMKLLRPFLLVLAIVLVAGCELLDPVVKNSQALFNDGRGEEALALLDKAQRDNPSRFAYKAEYARQRDLLISRWLIQADTLQQSGQLDVAATLYKRVQNYDPTNARARAGIAQIERDQRHRALIANAEALIKQN